MMKLFKKLTLVTTAAFLFLLTAVTDATPMLPLPGITIDKDANDDTLPKKPEIRPMADDSEDEDIGSVY